MLPLLLLPLLAASDSDLRSTPPGYSRALDRAIDRAHEQVIESARLWVDHSTWENAWEVSSENYVVRTTKSRYFAVQTAAGLENLLGRMHRVLGTDFVPVRKFRIWIFPTIAEYNAFGNSVNADEHSSWYGSFYDPSHEERVVAVLQDPNETRLGMFVWHGAVHQFVDQAFPGGRPLWLDEGLASYFSLAWDLSWGAAVVRNLVENGELVPLQRIFQTRSLAEYQGPTGTERRLAELGMFFRYLLDYREETRLGQGSEAPFVDYLRAILTNRDARTLPFYRLLERHWEGLEEDMIAFAYSF